MRNFLAGYISPRTDVHQMRENLSLLSFWGLVFSLIAVTLFVVIYSYQKSKYANREIVEDLRQRSVDVYLAAKTPEAESDSKRSREASNDYRLRHAITAGICDWRNGVRAIRGLRQGGRAHCGG
jgi:hypothetical protein